MTGALSGPVVECDCDGRLDVLLEYCGELESDVKDLRRRIGLLEQAIVLTAGIVLDDYPV